MTDRKRLIAIFMIVFVDLLGFSIILPLLPFYAESFGATPVMVGLVVSLFALAQMIGASALGRFSDRFGRRPLLLISIAGNALSFAFLGLAQTLFMLAIARLTAGFTAGSISVAQAYISDITSDKDRARGLGLIGAAFGLGFIIGPALGGLLSQWGYAVPAFTSAGIAVLNLVLAYFWLPESLTKDQRQQNAKKPAAPLTLKAMMVTLRRPLVGPLLHTRFFYGFAFAIFQSIFSLYGEYRFGLNAQSVGYVLAYVGFLSVLVQGVAIGRLSARFPDNTLILTSIGLLSAAFAAWAFAPSVGWLLVILAPIAFSAGVLNTVINSAISKTVAREEVGGILGLSASLESLTRTLAPTLSGYLLGQFGTSAPGLLAAVILLWLVTYFWRYIVERRRVTNAEAQL